MHSKTEWHYMYFRDGTRDNVVLTSALLNSYNLETVSFYNCKRILAVSFRSKECSSGVNKLILWMVCDTLTKLPKTGKLTPDIYF